MGERLICIQEVRSSILLGSTNYTLVKCVGDCQKVHMKVCAMTMVYQDHWALAQWVKHYSQLVGLEHLYIVAHGKDERVDQIAKGANIITIPRDTLEGFDSTRSRILNGLQASLSNVFDWVVRVDVDELIVLDTSIYKTLQSALQNCTKDAVFAVGCDLAQNDTGYDVLFTGHYSKAFAVSDDTRLFRHGVKLRSKLIDRYSFQKPQGIYLVHLKYANVDELIKANAHRSTVANGEGRGLPGKDWQQADKRAELFFAKLADMQNIPWSDASSDAHSRLSVDPIRDTEQSIVRARSLRFKQKTTPPTWFPKLD